MKFRPSLLFFVSIFAISFGHVVAHASSPGWIFSINESESEIEMQNSIIGNGESIVRIQLVNHSSESFGLMGQAIKPDKFRGKRVLFSGNIESSSSTGKGYFYIYTASPGFTGGYDYMENRFITGNQKRSRQQVVVDVPEDCVGITFGFIAKGSGKFWVDGFRFGSVSTETPITGTKLEARNPPSSERQLYFQRRRYELEALKPFNLGLREPILKEVTHTFKKVGDTELKADFIFPIGDRLLPYVVWLSGGQGSRGAVHQYIKKLFLDNNYAFVSIDHTSPEETRSKKIDSIVESIEWIRTEGARLYPLDNERMAMAGESIGGTLTLIAGYRVKPRPKALVSFAGWVDMIGDWSALPPNEAWRVERQDERLAASARLQPWNPFEEFDKYRPLMPISNVDKSYPPTIFIHGTKDILVPYGQSELMQNELTRNGVDNKLITIEDGGHLAFWSDGEVDRASKNKAHEEAFKFVNRYLGNSSHMVENKNDLSRDLDSISTSITLDGNVSQEVKLTETQKESEIISDPHSKNILEALASLEMAVESGVISSVVENQKNLNKVLSSVYEISPKSVTNIPLWKIFKAKGEAVIFLHSIFLTTRTNLDMLSDYETILELEETCFRISNVSTEVEKQSAYKDAKELVARLENHENHSLFETWVRIPLEEVEN